MKKTLLLACLFVLSVTFANAQRQFEMDPINSFIDSAGHPQDSVCYGQTIYINYLLKNTGDYTGTTTLKHDSFPGGTVALNLHISTTPDWPNPSVTATESLLFSGTPYGGTTSKMGSGIHIDSRFQPGLANIIIIWPNEGKMSGTMDSLDPNKYKPLSIYVRDESACEAAIAKGPAPKNFKVYPNPVKDVLNIVMTRAGKGTLTLTDIEGKMIATQPFEANAGGNVSITLNDGSPLPNGVYFLSVETSSYKEVSKIVVDK